MTELIRLLQNLSYLNDERTSGELDLMCLAHVYQEDCRETNELLAINKAECAAVRETIHALIVQQIGGTDAEVDAWIEATLDLSHDESLQGVIANIETLIARLNAATARAAG